MPGCSGAAEWGRSTSPRPAEWGEVYLAEELELGRTVALKLLPPHTAEDERFCERFLRESRLAASLNHPHIVPVYRAGEAEGVLFIAMHYVDGTDLRRILKESRNGLDPVLENR